MYGWKWKYPTDEWHRRCINEYQGLEIEPGTTDPAFIKLPHTRGAWGSDVESHELAVAWDDEAKAHFYQRDWTDSGSPFVSEGETYWSGWWFETVAERDRFKEFARTMNRETWRQWPDETGWWWCYDKTENVMTIHFVDIDDDDEADALNEYKGSQFVWHYQDEPELPR